jgi:cell division protein FtsQ
MSPVSVPSDRRFHRAHVKPVRRRRRWQRLAIVTITGAAVLGLAGFSLYWIGMRVARAGVLDVDRIEVRGNERLSTETVAESLADLRGENIFLTDLAAWRERLLMSPWVLDASLRRTLPSTVEIVITERRPIGFARLKDQLHLMDASGVLLGEAYADLDLPTVDGLALDNAPPDTRPYAAVKADGASLAARVIADLKKDPSVSQRLSQVIVSDPYNAAVILSDDPAVLYVGEDHFLSRVASYLEIAAKLRESTPDIEYADLRFVEDRIFVGPARQGRRSVVPASASGVRRR